MRIGKDKYFHLTYCTNIHPGESWEEVFENLVAYVLPLKERLAPDEPFGVGLRLSDRASREILEGDALADFRAWLDEHGLYVFTLNGFPYGGFHRTVVKDHVYEPDWRTTERVAYTVRLARILAALLPEGLDGGISTSPLSYKPWLAGAGAREDAFRRSARHLADVTSELARIEAEEGKKIHVDIEPEPDCLIENLDETLVFFEEWLLKEGARHLVAEHGMNADLVEEKLLDHVRVCYDTCHFAVEYEEPEVVLARLQDAGIKIGKVQLSAALRVPVPRDAAARDALAARLRPFAESTYFHQTIERRAHGVLHHYPDLPQALDHLPGTEGREWRIHYHVPIFVESFDGLESTQPDIAWTLGALRNTPTCPHLEIETYTWEVLPPDLKIDLTDSIEREFRWVLGQFG